MSIESVGNKLREAREERSVTLEQAAQATHIRARFLEALETGELGVLPSAVQVRGFLRSYADFLELDADELLSSLRQGHSSAFSAPAPPEATTPIEITSANLEADVIFTEVGQTLLERRELLGLSLEDVEQHTHIPEHYLKILESGQLEHFPSPTQARGMLGNYTKFLELDTGRILLRYADALQVRWAARRSVEPTTHSRPRRRPILPSWVRNLISADIIFGAIVVIALLSFVVWGVGRISATQASQEPEPTAPSLAGVLLPSSTLDPTATLTPTESEAPPVIAAEEVPEEEALETDATQEIVLPGIGTGIQINMVIHQRAWMKIVVDGEVEFEGRVIPGSAHSYSANEQIELQTGNAAALQVFYNEQDLGILGIFGEVVSVIYTTSGPITPTPTITPTANLTQPATPTETPTPLLPEEEPPSLP